MSSPLVAQGMESITEPQPQGHQCIKVQCVLTWYSSSPGLPLSACSGTEVLYHSHLAVSSELLVVWTDFYTHQKARVWAQGNNGFFSPKALGYRDVLMRQPSLLVKDSPKNMYYLPYSTGYIFTHSLLL